MKSSTSICSWIQSVIPFMAITLTIWFSVPTPAAAQLQSSGESRFPIVYVGTAGGGIIEVNTVNNLVVATAPFPNNANGVAGWPLDVCEQP